MIKHLIKTLEESMFKNSIVIILFFLSVPFSFGQNDQGISGCCTYYIKVDVKGVVDSVNDSYDIMEGTISQKDSIYATIIYDYYAVDTNSTKIHGNYYYTSAPNGIKATINHYTFESNLSKVDYLINVINDLVYDVIIFTSSNNIFNIHSRDEVEFDKTGIQFQLNDKTETTLSSDRLINHYDINDWNGKNSFTLNGGSYFTNGTLSIYIHGTITDIKSTILTKELLPIANKFDDKQFVIYPNPNNGNFILEKNISSGENLTLSVMNIHGKEIWNKNFNSNESRMLVGVPDLGEGMYLLKVQSGQGEVIKQIIIQ